MRCIWVLCTCLCVVPWVYIVFFSFFRVSSVRGVRSLVDGAGKSRSHILLSATNCEYLVVRVKSGRSAHQPPPSLLGRRSHEPEAVGPVGSWVVCLLSSLRSLPSTHVNVLFYSGMNPSIRTARPKEYFSTPSQSNNSNCDDHSEAYVLHADRQSHPLNECRVFVCKTPDERWEIVREHKHCYLCLGDNYSSICRVEQMCETYGSRHRHHTLLHRNKLQFDNQSSPSLGGSQALKLKL